MFLANDIAAIAKLGEITPVNTVEFIDLFSEALIYRLKSSAGQGKRKQDASKAALAAADLRAWLNLMLKQLFINFHIHTLLTYKTIKL